MTTTISEAKILQALTTIFGLPKNIRSFEIRGAVNERITARITYFPTAPDGTQAYEAITQRFCLVPLEPQGEAVAGEELRKRE